MDDGEKGREAHCQSIARPALTRAREDPLGHPRACAGVEKSVTGAGDHASHCGWMWRTWVCVSTSSPTRPQDRPQPRRKPPAPPTDYPHAMPRLSTCAAPRHPQGSPTYPAVVHRLIHLTTHMRWRSEAWAQRVARYDAREANPRMVISSESTAMARPPTAAPMPGLPGRREAKLMARKPM